MEIKKLHKRPSERSFTNGIHSMIKRADAKKRAGIIYHVTHISLVYGSGIIIDVIK